MKEKFEDLNFKKNELRKDVLKMITIAENGHPGGSLSCIDIILYLYKMVMKHDPKNPKWEQRDRFVLSKGHGVPALYAVLSDEGYFDKELLFTLRKLGSPLQGHPANRLLGGIEASTGSLGQGLSVALGMALSARINRKNDPLFNVYTILGDGEMQEGQIWEALMAASFYNVNNLCVFIDRNQAQIDGFTKEVMDIEPLKEKLLSFGMKALEIDGHNFEEMENAINIFKKEEKKPVVIIANTIKGKGVPFLEEDKVGWHGKALSKEELDLAILALKE